MAVRVRKLAKEMDRGPVEILGLLHAIGFDRYRSPDDMLPDPVLEKVRRAIRDGVRPVKIAGLEADAAPSPRPRPAAEPGDWMAKLVPGVQRAGAPREASRAVKTPDPAKPADVPASAPAALLAERDALLAAQAELSAERAALSAERDTLLRERNALLAALAAMVAERDALLGERNALLGERDALSAEQDRMRESTRSPRGASLAEILHGRGLRGQDEMERALAALVASRAAGELISRLRADDPEPVERLLRDRLSLFGAAGPDLPPGAVVVAPERAEIPADLSRRVSRFGERLLLNGLRRVALVGGRPVAHRALRGLDPRIELRVVPALARTRADAEQDVTRTDAVILWGIRPDPGADEVYGTSRAVVLRVEGSDLTSLFDGIDRVLG